MNTVQSLQLKFELMMKEVPGEKVLLLDTFTLRSLTLVRSNSELLKKDVLIVDRLENTNRDKFPNLRCVVFVRPTEENGALLKVELKKPKYKSYSLYFSTVLDFEVMQMIAEGDVKHSVDHIKEIFGDFLAPDDPIFSLGIRSIVPLLHGRDDVLFNRITKGLLASVLSFSSAGKPLIRFSGASTLCYRLAQTVSSLLEEEKTCALFKGNRREECLLFIYDRRDDAVTPLLTQWTYQAMVHELHSKGIQDNVVSIKLEEVKREEETEGEDDEASLDEKKRKKEEKKANKQEILYSTLNDEFLQTTRYFNWGVLCGKMKSLVEVYKTEMKSKADLKSIDDIRNFLDNYSSYAKTNRTVNDHMTIVSSLKDSITKRHLMTLSRIEQEIVCSGHNHGKNFEDLMECVEKLPLRKDDVTRLICLYSLRYEDYGRSQLSEIEEKMFSKGFSRGELQSLSRGILKYGGNNVRRSKLLFGSDKVGGVGGFFRRMKSALTDVENVFTQHSPLIINILTKLLGLEKGKGKRGIRMGVDEKVYPFLGLTSKNVPSKVIVYVVGGATYEEVRGVAEINRRAGRRRVVLGTDVVLNSRKFLKEVKKFSAPPKQKKEEESNL